MILIHYIILLILHIKYGLYDSIKRGRLINITQVQVQCYKITSYRSSSSSNNMHKWVSAFIREPINIRSE